MHATMKNKRELFREHNAFSSHDFDHTKEVMAGFYPELSLEPYATDTPFHANINQLSLNHIHCAFTHVKNGIQFNSHTPLQSLTLEFQMSGYSYFDIHGQQSRCSNKQPLIIAPGDEGRCVSTPNSRILDVIIDEALIKQTLQSWLGHFAVPDLVFELKPDISQPTVSTALWNIFHQVTQLDDSPFVLQSPAAIASLEMTIVTSLLLTLPNSAQIVMTKPQPMTDLARVKRVEDYIYAHSHQPITIQTLAEIACCSVSSLFRTFNRYRDYTPLQLINKVRLRNAHHQLMQARAKVSVSEVAASCGFNHLGRFSLHYKQEFGELPSQTLKKHR